MVEFCDRFSEQVGELIVCTNIVGSCNKSVAKPPKETKPSCDGRESPHSTLLKYEAHIRHCGQFSILEKDLKMWCYTTQNYSEHTIP